MRRMHYSQVSFVVVRDVDIMTYIKLWRLRWTEHVMRITEDELPRKVLTIQLHGKRKRGSASYPDSSKRLAEEGK